MSDVLGQTAGEQCAEREAWRSVQGHVNVDVSLTQLQHCLGLQQMPNDTYTTYDNTVINIDTARVSNKCTTISTPHDDNTVININIAWVSNKCTTIPAPHNDNTVINIDIAWVSNKCTTIPAPHNDNTVTVKPSNHQCDARPSQQHGTTVFRPSAKLYCLLMQACVNNLPKDVSCGHNGQQSNPQLASFKSNTQTIWPPGNTFRINSVE